MDGEKEEPVHNFRRLRRSQSLDQSSDLAVERNHCLFRPGTVQVIDVPVFDQICPEGKLLRHHRSMLGVLDGHHQVGASQVGQSQGHRLPMITVERSIFIIAYLGNNHGSIHQNNDTEFNWGTSIATSSKLCRIQHFPPPLVEQF